MDWWVEGGGGDGRGKLWSSHLKKHQLKVFSGKQLVLWSITTAGRQIWPKWPTHWDGIHSKPDAHSTQRRCFTVSTVVLSTSQCIQKLKEKHLLERATLTTICTVNPVHGLTLSCTACSPELYTCGTNCPKKQSQQATYRSSGRQHYQPSANQHHHLPWSARRRQVLRTSQDSDTRF